MYKENKTLLLSPTFQTPHSMALILSHHYCKEMYPNIYDCLIFTNIELRYIHYFVICVKKPQKLNNTYGYFSLTIHLDLHNLLNCCMILLHDMDVFYLTLPLLTTIQIVSSVYTVTNNAVTNIHMLMSLFIGAFLFVEKSTR